MKKKSIRTTTPKTETTAPPADFEMTSYLRDDLALRDPQYLNSGWILTAEEFEAATGLPWVRAKTRCASGMLKACFTGDNEIHVPDHELTVLRRQSTRNWTDTDAEADARDAKRRKKGPYRFAIAALEAHGVTLGRLKSLIMAPPGSNPTWPEIEINESEGWVKMNLKTPDEIWRTTAYDTCEISPKDARNICH